MGQRSPTPPAETSTPSLGAALGLLLLVGCGPKEAPPPRAAVQASPAAAPAPLPVVDTAEPDADEVLVRVHPGRAVGLELVCTDGYRERVTLGTGPEPPWLWGRFEGVGGSDCTLHFKGGAPARQLGLAAGDALTCDLVGSTAVCGDLGEALTAEETGLQPLAGVLQVQVTEANGAHALELTCAGKRHWVPLTSGLARVADLPPDGCRGRFQGAAGEIPETGGGRVLTCRLSSAGAACTEVARLSPETVAQRAAAAAPVALPADAVWVEVAEPAEVQAVELSCTGDYRDRAELDAERQARFSDVSGTCTLHLRGPVTGRFGPVAPGQALACAFVGTILTCTDLSGPE